MIEIQNIPKKGRGVVSIQRILKETLIENSPVSPIPPEHLTRIDNTEVFKYYFVRPSEYSTGKTSKGYLVFGLVSLCNHSEKPNARVAWIENEIGLWCHLMAEKTIEPGEEITLRYANFDQYLDRDRFVEN